MSEKLKILIVGGGFGGIKTALNLGSNPNVDVTVVSDRDVFMYYPTLYKTITGSPSNLSRMNIQEIIKSHENIKFIKGTAVSINKKHKTLKLETGDKIEYDKIILALGTKTNYFNIPGLKEYSYGLKTPDEADELKMHLHNQLTDKRMPDLNYVVIGGGPTGIELASALPEYLKTIMVKHGVKNRKVHVDLVEAMPRLMPKMPKSVSYALAKRLHKLGIKLYLKTPVQAETANTLVMAGKEIRSHTVIWTAGVANNPFFANNHFTLSQNGKVLVDKYMQSWPDVFVIGDSADTPYSGMAQTALREANLVSDNIIRELEGKKLRSYKPKQPICIIPVGKAWAAMKWGKIELYGKIAWWLRKVADMRGFSEFEPWWKATDRLMDDNDSEESCVHCVD